MADIKRGKAIFDTRIEYPLPKNNGSRDFVFYFVPQSDGYGRGARNFFGRFYRDHISAEVSSLEGLIEVLHSAILERGISQIREMVLVSHGNAEGLLLHLVNDVTTSHQPEYKYLTPLSLALLQKDFREGQFASFANRRKRVLKHLTTESWVTVRACNFGRSRAGLYALYSFFGGLTNVYAPTEYQFFGSQPIAEGMRFDTTVKVHQHLIKQRFLPRDVHTPERLDAVVRAMTDPGQFSEPFDVATVPLVNPEPTLANRYRKLVDDLNAGRPNALLQARFQEQALPLSRRHRIAVKSRDSAWLIKDVLQHAGDSFNIEYHLSEEIVVTGSSTAEKNTAIRVQARLSQTRSAHEYFPLQLFFYESEHKLWRGERFTLAFYMEEPDSDPTLKSRFDALVGQLNAGRFSDSVSGIDLRAKFRDEADVEITNQARIRTLHTRGAGPSLRIVWALEDATPYLLKLEHPVSSRGIPAHTVTVYSNPGAKDRMLREYELMSFLGSSPDTPGTELASYLDRFSLEDLSNLIAYLRTPHRPGNSIYIQQAQQALRRKKGFFDWFRQRHPDLATVPLLHDSEADLSLFEMEELRALTYQFDFNGFWSEVKCSSPSATEFQSDLFDEEDLAKVLGIGDEVLASREAPSDVDPDSPYADLAELRDLERQGVEQFFATEKFIFNPPPEDLDISCAEFAELLAKWKELQNQDATEIEKALGLLKTSDGKTYLQWVAQLWDMSFPVRMALQLNNMSQLKDGLLVKAIARIPGVVTSVADGVILRSTTLALLRVWPVISIPWTMYKHFLMEQEKTAGVWEAIGKITAIRQSLRQLELLTFESDFPERIVIDVSSPTSAHPYYVGRYYDEQVAERGRYFSFVFAPDRMRKGYDEGVQIMQQALPDILANAEEAVRLALAEKQLDACKIKVIIDAGLFDAQQAKAHAIRAIVRSLLDKLPKV